MHRVASTLCSFHARIHAYSTITTECGRRGIIYLKQAVPAGFKLLGIGITQHVENHTHLHAAVRGIMNAPVQCYCMITGTTCFIADAGMFFSWDLF